MITMAQEKDSLLASSSSYGTTGGSVLTSPSFDTDNDLLSNNDEESLTKVPLRSDLESGMSSDVSAGVAAGPDFLGNRDADTDAGSFAKPTDAYTVPESASSFETTSFDTPSNPFDAEDYATDAKDSTEEKSPIAAIADNAKAQAGQLADQAKSQVSALTAQATDKVKEQISTHKGKAAEGLGAVSQAVHQTADSLTENGQPQISAVANSIASQIDGLTNYLRDKDIDQIAAEVTDYARQNPQVFIGGAFLLGIAFARFLKSSQRTNASAGSNSYSRLDSGSYSNSGAYSGSYSNANSAV